MTKLHTRGVGITRSRNTIRTLPVLSLLLMSAGALAQSDRAGEWEAGFTLLDLSSVNIGARNGSALSVDDETGFGFSGAYNMTNRLGLGLDISWSDPDYTATLVPESGASAESINGQLSVNVIHFKGIFNLLDNAFTPYLEVGAGWTYLDSNVVEGISTPGCWWTWYGYYCPTYVDTYTETRTSYSYAVGVRWEMNSDMLLKASWGEQKIDTGSSAEDLTLDTIQMTLAWRF